MTEQHGKLSLPRLVSASFRHFSLYNLKPKIDIEFPDGVFCLAGANGLGKSTFLLAINYAITGRVPEPDRPFISLEDYHNKTRDFSTYFFDGRINEHDREVAEIEIQLRIGDWEVNLTRGLFDPDGIRALWFEQEDGQLHEVKGSPTQLQANYQAEITQRAGLASFEQLVFLQHFVLTFDERRFLLFWSRRELEQTLYLSIGLDTKIAKRFDFLQDKAQKADSRGRNTVSHASAIRAKLKELERALLDPKQKRVLDNVETRYAALQNTSDQVIDRFERIDASLRDAATKLAELSAEQTTLRAEYDAEFSKRMEGSSDIRHHPIIRESITEGRCQLCDSHRAGISASIEKQLKSEHCPICGTKIIPRTHKDFARLKSLDKQLSLRAIEISDQVKKIDRLTAEHASAGKDREIAANELKRFSKQYRKEIARLEADSTPGVNNLLDDYKRQIDELESEKQKQYQQRDKYREELRPLQRKLENQYRNAEHVFVPMFKKLAESFLGVELNVVFELSRTTGISLVLDVAKDPRREYHQLSESQRFFVDIALRMALMKYMSAATDPGCLYLDTPEGSLDIAYETKAGEMIAQFVQDGFGCIMTANINTSRLLQSLAEGCDQESMTLYRMTTWADLSKVQATQEESFDEAFSAIEKKIKSKKKGK